MAIVTSLACDLCRDQPADTWQITQAGLEPFLIDLCSECAAPLRLMRSKGKLPNASKRSPRTGIIKSIHYKKPPNTDEKAP